MNNSVVIMPDGGAALRLSMPAQDNSTPTHLIALIDTSESMSESNKLEHVKHCMSLVLRILSSDDCISVITFGDQATTLLENVPTDAANTAAITSAIQQIRTEGCTNLSDGLVAVQSVLLNSVNENEHRKTLLLILTDGYANRGVVSPDNLLQITQRLQESFPSLSITSIAYGTDHNANLLTLLAERARGAYSIVKSLEDAALTIGDAVGGAMSCVLQNITVHVPPGTTVHGPYKVTPDNKILLGDGYSGSQTLILLDFPEGQAESLDMIRVTGVRVPSLEPENAQLTFIQHLDEPDDTIYLTRIRYEVAELFTSLSTWTAQTSEEERADFIVRVNTVNAMVSSAQFRGNIVAEMLKMEITSLRTAIQRVTAGAQPSADLGAMLTQHAAFNSLARGTTRAISPVNRRLYSMDQELTEDDNPVVPSARNTSVLSPTSSHRQRRVANLLRTMSQQPE